MVSDALAWIGLQRVACPRLGFPPVGSPGAARGAEGSLAPHLLGARATRLREMRADGRWQMARRKPVPLAVCDVLLSRGRRLEMRIPNISWAGGCSRGLI